MKLADRPRLELLYKVDNIVIPCQKGQVRLLNGFLEGIGELDLTKEYEVKIAKKKVKRSLDANAYCWVLIGRLGEKLHKSDLEIYQEIIRDNGVFEVMPVRKDVIARWTEIWKSRGMGWICEDIGECRNIKGYHNIKCYYGSSVYDTAEMSRLIDAVVSECKEQGVETMTPDEIEEMKQKWGTT